MMWPDGLQRLWPAWELYIGHHTVPAAVGVALIMGIVFTLLIIYPFFGEAIQRRLRPPQPAAAPA